MKAVDICLGLGMTIFMYLLHLGIYWYVTRFPPLEVNRMYGYRTPRSMKNQANWTYANALSNRLMLWTANIYVVTALLLFLLFFKVLSGQWYIGISTGLYLISWIVVLILTEYKLKQFEKTQK